MPLAVNCPACGEPLEVEDEYRAWKVRCPRCRHEFHPDAGEAAPDADPEPPRRRRRSRYEDDSADPRAAAAEVAGAATGLKVVGWIGLVFAPLAVLLWVFILVMTLNNAQFRRNMGRNQDEVIGEAVFYIVQGAVAFVISAVIVRGAGKLARLESKSWATAAAVLSMVPCLSPCCLLGLPFGIMALTAMGRPNVQDAFRRNEQRRAPRYTDDYED